jgi:hypothetical protein
MLRTGTLSAGLFLVGVATTVWGQVQPPVEGGVWLFTDNSSSVFIACNSYGYGQCNSDSPPFASCSHGASLFPLAAHYCSVWIPAQNKGVDGYCYSYLCTNGYDFQSNVGLGYQALNADKGRNNVAIGSFALYNDLGTGSPEGNIAIGNGALSNAADALYNIVIGYRSGGNLVNGDGNIYLGGLNYEDESFTIRIGSAQNSATFIEGIRSAVLTDNPLPVYIDSEGRLGLLSTSQPEAEELNQRMPGVASDPLCQRSVERIVELERRLLEQQGQLDFLSTKMDYFLRRSLQK